MTSPIVVVSRDLTRDPLRVEWFDNENSFYAEDPLAWIEYHPGRDTWRGDAGRNAPDGVVLAAARLLLDLVLGVRPYPMHVATHTVAEPGAPLEPIAGRAA